MQITCLILARGGSKGIPGKNTKEIGGLPLLAWTITAAQDFKKFDSIWVSTDCNHVAQVALKFGAEVHRRPSELALDSTPSIDAVTEFLSHHTEVRHLALLQCTSPCVQPRFLDEAYKMMSSGTYDCVFAVRKEFPLRWTLAATNTDDSHDVPSLTQPMNFDPKARPRRQDWSGEIVECGMFYFTRIELLKTGCFQGGRCGYVEIPREYSLEIDTPYDWLLAKIVVPLYGYRRVPQCAN